jgi:hypothetical protein
LIAEHRTTVVGAARNWQALLLKLLQPLRELLVFELELHELIGNSFVAQSKLALKPLRIKLTLA